jgi:hypothetical protein
MDAREAAVAARDLMAGYDAEKPALMADALHERRSVFWKALHSKSRRKARAFRRG